MAAAAAAIHRGKPSRVVWAVARLANKRELEMAHSSDAFQSHPPSLRPLTKNNRNRSSRPILPSMLVELLLLLLLLAAKAEDDVNDDWSGVGGSCSLHAGGAFICHCAK